MKGGGARRHPSRPPDVAELLAVLGGAEVRFVLAGSSAILLHGIELVPGDLDVVPETSPANLARLIGVLEALEAWPLGPFGAWTTTAGGESKWIARATSEEELARWRPAALEVATLDHSFGTSLGDLDVVPEVAGTHSELMLRARGLSYHGAQVWVAHPDDLLARITVPRRDQDVPRVAALRALQRRGS